SVVVEPSALASGAITAPEPKPSATVMPTAIAATVRERDRATFASPTTAQPDGCTLVAGGTNALSLSPFGQPSVNVMSQARFAAVLLPRGEPTERDPDLSARC